MKLVPNSISSKVARQALLASKNSPTILFGAGVVGVIGSTVLACRATLKLEEILEKTHANLMIAKNIEDGNYTESDRQKDIALIYVQTTAGVAKLYAPALLLGLASISALTASHNILNRRNVAITAAYAALDQGFSEYRERVVDKYGEEEDRNFRYANEQVEVEGSKGKTKTVTRASPDAMSIYAKFFDEYSTEWSTEPEYNLVFLRCQQNYANDMLKARGHLFLNEVYRMLGIEHSSAGSVVGWVISNDGDNFVDFGLYDDRGDVRDFVNGREGSILLDFNVDGVIYDKIENKGAIQWQS